MTVKVTAYAFYLRLTKLIKITARPRRVFGFLSLLCLAIVSTAFHCFDVRKRSIVSLTVSMSLSCLKEIMCMGILSACTLAPH